MSGNVSPMVVGFLGFPATLTAFVPNVQLLPGLVLGNRAPLMQLEKNTRKLTQHGSNNKNSSSNNSSSNNSRINDSVNSNSSKSIFISLFAMR